MQPTKKHGALGNHMEKQFELVWLAPRIITWKYNSFNVMAHCNNVKYFNCVEIKRLTLIHMVQKWVRNPSRAQKEKQLKQIFYHLNTVHVMGKNTKTSVTGSRNTGDIADLLRTSVPDSSCIAKVMKK